MPCASRAISVGVVAVLQVVRVEAAEADEEDLPLRAERRRAPRIDHAGHHLQLLRERVERVLPPVSGLTYCSFGSLLAL